MKHVTAGDLDVAYRDVGPANALPVVLLHGFPYDVHAYDEVVERLVAAGRRCIVPYLRGFGPTRFRSTATVRSGQQAALGADLLALMDALAIPKAILAGYDWGGRAACVLAALMPARVAGLVTGGRPYNVQDPATVGDPVAPEAEQRHWYWYYLNSERGRVALMQDRARLCRHLWRTFSPTWSYREAEFAATVTAFDNPDFVDVVLHSYRYRIGSVPGDPKLEETEQRFASKPQIEVPTVVLMGEDDGVDPPVARSEIEPHFTDLRAVETLPHVGHNVPQEAPAAFARAVLDLSAV